jgi:tetratricopeptide (TPR) repeat protein
MLEAMACGVVPVVSVGTVAAECASGVGLALTNDTFQGIAEGLRKLLSENFSLANEKQRVVDHMREHFSLQKTGSQLKAAIAELVSEKPNSLPVKKAAAASVEGIHALIKQNNFDEALVRLETQLLMPIGKGMRAEVLRLKGDVLYHMSRLDEAMEAYSECLRSNADDFEAYRGLGYISLKGHSHEEALTFFKKSLAKRDGDLMSLLGIAMVHRRLTLSEESLFWLEKAVELHRDNPKAISSYVQTCLECTTTETPISSLQKLIENLGDEPTLMATLGQLYLREGNDKLGNEWIEKANKLQSNKVAA